MFSFFNLSFIIFKLEGILRFFLRVLGSNLNAQILTRALFVYFNFYNFFFKYYQNKIKNFTWVYLATFVKINEKNEEKAFFGRKELFWEKKLRPSWVYVWNTSARTCWTNTTTSYIFWYSFRGVIVCLFFIVNFNFHFYWNLFFIGRLNDVYYFRFGIINFCGFIFVLWNIQFKLSTISFFLYSFNSSCLWNRYIPWFFSLL